MTILKNPSNQEIAALIKSQSASKTARRLLDEATGDVYVWPAEIGTHRQIADKLKLSYSRPPGAGDIITLG
jgi:hypothetical protein